MTHDSSTAGQAPQPAAPRCSKLLPAGELRSLLLLAVPLTISNLLERLMPVTDMAFVGQLGALELGATSAAISFAALGFYFIVGFASVLDTYLSQAYGAGRYTAMGVWFQRGLFWLAMLCVPVGASWLLAEPIIRDVMRQQADVAALAAVYLRYYLPSMPLNLATRALNKWLLAQGIARPQLLAVLLAVLMNAGANAVLVPALGFHGSPIATTISSATRLIVLLLWVYFAGPQRRKPTWGGFSREAFTCDASVREFLKVGLAGGVMTGLEAAAFVGLTFVAGTMGTIELDAFSVLSTISGLCFFSFPFGMATAVGMRVGTLLGANKHEQAKQSARLALTVGISASAIVAVVAYVLRRQLAHLFTQDEDVVDAFVGIALLGCVYSIEDALQGINGGLMRGMGRQRLAASLNLLGFWLLGIPAALLLAFVAHWGLYGVPFGLVIGLGIVGCLFGIFLLRTDWAEQAKKARERTKKKKDDTEGESGDVELLAV
eukprot:PLAT2896.1.p1 GENE.PLAT2896.1~~PLAT2896.1.p1  ORF type:complete len:490 (+),score=268.83 PLAT2896.1:33-1502(+)